MERHQISREQKDTEAQHRFEMKQMTALVSAFARAYHYKNNHRHIFADPLAKEMLTDEEYAAISQNMSQGISYFAPGFCGTQEEALRFIVDHQLSPSVLARSAFCERAVRNAAMPGCRQIILFACGYDTFSLRTKDNRLQVFELDRPEMIADRQRRIRKSGLEPGCRQVCIGCDLALTGWKDDLVNAGFHAEKQFFGSLLGISYYLTKDAFRNLLMDISSIFCTGSFICFDYPQSSDGTESADEIERLAELDGEVVGTAGIGCVARKEKTRHRAEFGISVDKSHWGLGIGRALIEACIGCARNAGYVQLELDCTGGDFIEQHLL